MAHQYTAVYLADSLSLFQYYKTLAERALAQASDEDLYRTLGPETNSIAVIMKHMAGNMRSRWTDFLTTDGEKPNRQRDTEFEAPPATRAELMAMWDEGWRLLFAALTPLDAADLARAVTIRSEPHSVMQAINRQLAHYAMHAGQIVLLARHWTGGGWTSLTVPKGKSGEFNLRVERGEASQR